MRKIEFKEFGLRENATGSFVIVNKIDDGKPEEVTVTPDTDPIKPDKRGERKTKNVKKTKQHSTRDLLIGFIKDTNDRFENNRELLVNFIQATNKKFENIEGILKRNNLK
ncbi:MAG: hypothetical protein LBQ45_00275 [Mycoplasmataceae bacterium]|jgi:hypothetical protein|nr:hypothetical protein [Mycoplasmataceae bacterium]